MFTSLEAHSWGKTSQEDIKKSERVLVLSASDFFFRNYENAHWQNRNLPNQDPRHRLHFTASLVLWNQLDCKGIDFRASLLLLNYLQWDVIFQRWDKNLVLISCDIIWKVVLWDKNQLTGAFVRSKRENWSKIGTATELKSFCDKWYSANVPDSYWSSIMANHSWNCQNHFTLSSAAAGATFLHMLLAPSYSSSIAWSL